MADSDEDPLDSCWEDIKGPKPAEPDPDIPYLQAVEHGPYDPTGWLYSSIYSDLEDRGFVVYTSRGFKITASGVAKLHPCKNHE